jgi:hypothetical protein
LALGQNQEQQQKQKQRGRAAIKSKIRPLTTKDTKGHRGKSKAIPKPKPQPIFGFAHPRWGRGVREKVVTSECSVKKTGPLISVHQR